MDQTPVALPRSRAFTYDGRIGELYSIFLLNLLFTMLTLGIFRFWAITRYRRYFWSRMVFQGNRFEYTGTGGELFVGYLLAGLVLIGAAIAAAAAGYVLSLIAKPLAVLPIMVLYVCIFILAAGAVYSAQRYRLSRTLWCGIRGGMTGSMFAYGLRSVLYTMLAGLTLFQMVPWMQVRLAERRINASSFGNARFSFQGSAGRLYGPYVLTLIGVAATFGVVTAIVFAVFKAFVPTQFVPEVGLSHAAVQLIVFLAIGGFLAFTILSALVTCWYSALFERHVVGRTALGAMRCASSMTGRGLLGLVLGNMLIALFTLGLGMPVVLHRNARFLARTLWVDGALDPAALGQSTLSSPAFGEGMFQQLDATGWL